MWLVRTVHRGWRTLHGGCPDVDACLVQSYCDLVATELTTACLDIIAFLRRLIDTATTHNANANNEPTEIAFYHKMMADYYRYLSEVRPNSKQYRDESAAYYDKAMKCLESLPVTHPTRLGMLLSYAMQCYEILNQPQKAIEIAQNAFDEALQNLDTMDDAQYKDATLIMQLLRDNLTLWTAEQSEQQERNEKIVYGFFREMQRMLNMPSVVEIPHHIHKLCIAYLSL